MKAVVAWVSAVILSALMTRYGPVGVSEFAGANPALLFLTLVVGMTVSIWWALQQIRQESDDRSNDE